MTRSALLDAGHESRFRADGFVILDLLDAEDVARLRAAHAAHSPATPDAFMATVLLSDLPARARIDREVGAVLARRVLPVLDDYRVVVGSFAVKQPSQDDDDGFVGLHQDLSFVDEPRFAGVSLWCPLEEVDERNGCLAVVVGSHRFNSFYREPCSLPYPELVPLLEHDYLTHLRMTPGQALLMDNRLFHESRPNRTGRTRLVAAGVAVPRESRLLYCHRDLDRAPDRLEVFEVPDDFYVRHSIGQRPREGRHAATVPHRVAELTAARLREQCAAPG